MSRKRPIEQCRLCQKMKPLCMSHIIPEFLYKPLYDDKHRLMLVPEETDRTVQVRQSGLKERLLCAECESRLSGFEEYGKRLIDGGKVTVKVAEQNREFTVYSGVNYTKLKLFQLSLLWKSGVSQHPFFSIVKLGRHEESLRQMVHNEVAGKPFEYGCIMNTLLLKNDLLDVIIPPSRYSFDGHVCYRFPIAGIVWNFIVSRHSSDFWYRDLFLDESGRLIMIREDASNVEYVRKLKESFKNRGDDIPPFLRKA